jgi:hypothetical protein
VITAIAPIALTRSWSRIKNTILAARNLSRATHRQASRGEGSAYRLLGLFDLNMPMLCGEGEQKAFVRLQKAIYKKDADHSLFPFRPRLGPDTVPLFAESTSEYCQRLKLRSLHCWWTRARRVPRCPILCSKYHAQSSRHNRERPLYQNRMRRYHAQTANNQITRDSTAVHL